MSQPTLKISFPGQTAADAGILAAELEEEIQMAGEDVTVRRVRESPDSQDFGATLILILGTAAVTELAKGIAAWIKKKGATVEFTVGDKKLLVRDVDSSNLPGILAAACSPQAQ